MARLIHIIDDDTSALAAASLVLTHLGFETRLYEDGAQFLGQGDFERGCILLDLNMAEMDGHMVLEALSWRGADLPVIIQTGSGEIPPAVRAMKWGALDVLKKPYSNGALIDAIARAFEQLERQEEADQAQSDALAKLQLLTPRETQVLQGLQAGMGNKEIARWLNLSPRTVEMHRAHMMAKIGVTRLTQALRIALDGNLPRIDSDRVSSGGGSSCD